MKEPVPLDQLVEAWTDRRNESPPVRRITAPSYGPLLPEFLPTLQIRNPRLGTAASAAAGAFFSIYDDAGDLYLQGGTINSLAVDTADLQIYDAGTASWLGTAGQHLYVPVVGAFIVVDSVALPGFSASSIGTPGIGSVPANTFPAVTGTTTASNGTCNVSLGVFTDSGFLPSRLGNRVISLCITPPYTGDV